MVPKPPCPLVAIGGSAGSVEALIHFFEVMPEDCGIAFIVVVHMAPTQESLLSQLLQRRCALKVLMARDKLKISAGEVYVIPPGQVLTAQQGYLTLQPLSAFPGRPPVIDLLFASVASAGRDRALAGILFSGGDSDGTAGLQRIKQAGGYVMAQDPAEAQQDAMPRAAIDSGCTDAILRVSEMPARLLSALGSSAVPRQTPVRRDLKTELPHKLTAGETSLVRQALELMRLRTRRDFTCYRPSVVLRHLQRRMELHATGEDADYLQLLASDDTEPQALQRELLVSVTEFFRDAEAFEALATFLPTLFEGKDEADFVRVWVPACATGEEAYSIAMLLLEYAGTLAQPPGIQVIGCDLDGSAIEKARSGMYRASTAQRVGPARLTRFFQKEGDGYRVRRELRQIVMFAEHDVLWDQNFSRMDLISCRNLLIYLTTDGQRRMMEVFEQALTPQGLLFLGPVEGLRGLSKAFEPVSPRHRIYCRGDAPRALLPDSASLRKSLQAEQAAIGKASNARGNRASSEYNQLQNQLAQLQQKLRVSGGGSANGAAEKQQLQVISQELQATLEELEVNRQELRSMNAELTAVNQVLGEKLAELEQTNTDLSNLMNAAAIPMVFLNRELKIMRYTPRALDLFRLIPSDLGRVLSDLQNALVYPELMDDARNVLEGGDPIEHEVRETGGRWYLARVLPYHAPQDPRAGVVLTFFDITERKQASAALQASEERLRSFISATSESVYEMSADWQEMRSLEGKKFIATTDNPRRDWADAYIPDEEKERVWSAIQRAIAARGYFELEHRVVRIDGSTGWVFSRAIPLLDAQGNIVKWFGTASDITERKRTEEALHESEELYRSLFNSIDEGFCLIEVLFDAESKPVDYRFIEVNPAVARQIGIENVEQRWMRQIAPPHEEDWYQIFGRVALTGTPVRFEGAAQALGRYFDVYAFRVGEPGQRRVGVLFNDISTRKRADFALRASELRMRLALEATEMAYYVWYPEDDTTEADARMLSLFGLPAGASLKYGAGMATMVHPDDRARHQAMVRHALDPAGDGVLREELRIIGADGIERWLVFHSRTTFGGEPRQAMRLSGVVRDVTAQHLAMEDLRESAEQVWGYSRRSESAQSG